jgi:uncharacterized membrane protein
MKKFLIWFLAFIITIGAAYYQRKTGPTYPKRIRLTVNDSITDLKLIRSIGLDERSEIKLALKDTSVKAILFYKKFKTDEEYATSGFQYKVYPLNSFVMNKIFKMTEESGFFAELPKQPAAGKLQYYIEIVDSKGSQFIQKEEPVVVRYKGSVPGFILTPHILFMFFAMLFSTGAGLLAIAKVPSYKKYGIWTLILLTAGGMILGPVVQKYAFGDLWTGIPFGWDLTDNKTLIAFFLWILAVYMNYKKERPIYTILAAIGLLIVYSIPHSLFGSELDYTTGQVTQGIILLTILKYRKKT